MRKILFRLTDKKMSMKSLGEFEPIKFEITLEVPHCFGQLVIELIKEKAKEWLK